ncbi:hypothetical protein QCN29_07255 [Streptomyces sp. HNM0663]|uniref:Uncharacterized protein n=1 Tax=Streptomyces chengmaiensis TaxID=3040919 RepID=A0ABT6HKM1_9ACTN|nr:hypothetical protein [Streptomyces chengmaiensis]MDH2388584.1 hypothetical protein [Streptomyces chengmaiensis]
MCYSPQAHRDLEAIGKRDQKTASAIYAIAEGGLPPEVDKDDPDDGLANGFRVRCAITREQRRKLPLASSDETSGPHNYVIVYRPCRDGDKDGATGKPCTATFTKLRILHVAELFEEYELIRGLYGY